MQDIATAAEQSAVVKPRYGAFSAAQLTTTIGAAAQSAATKQAGSNQVLYFVEFYQVDGFLGSVPAWIFGWLTPSPGSSR